MNTDEGQRWIVVEEKDGERAIEKAFDICEVGTVDKSVKSVSVELMEAERLDNVSVIETAKAENTNTINGGKMEEALLRAGYYAQKERIEQLESWIEQAIMKPAMSREMRLQGLDIVEATCQPEVRQAVERICPNRTQSLEHSLEIER